MCVCVSVCVHLQVIVQEQEPQVEGIEWRGVVHMVAAISVNSCYFSLMRASHTFWLRKRGRRKEEEETYLETDKTAQAFLKLY